MSVKYYPAPLRFRPKRTRQPAEPKADAADTTQADGAATKNPSKKKARK